MVRQRFGRLASWLSVCLLMLAPFLVWEYPAAAQTLTGLGFSEDEINTRTNVPTFIRGNLNLAPVFLDGKTIGAVSSFINLDSGNGGNLEETYDAATRAHLIHSKLQKVLENMVDYSREVLPTEGIVQPEQQETFIRERLFTSASEQEGNAVVSVKFPREGDVAEIVYSVTQSDIARPRFGSSQPMKIANDAANIVERSLVQAWRERQTPHLQVQSRQAFLALLGITIVSTCMAWGQRVLGVRSFKIDKMMVDSSSVQHQQNWISGLAKISGRLRKEASKGSKQNIRYLHSLNEFYKAIFFWAQWLLWMLGIGYLTSLFYWSRPWSNWIFGVTVRGIRGETVVVGWPPVDWLLSFGLEANLGMPLFILLFVLITRLTIKGGDALCDFFARGWGREVSRQRHALRSRTLSRATKAWLRAIVYLLLGVAIVERLHQLGTITQAIGIFIGFFSFALSLASQNILKDLIAGLLILWEDQYAVGDVICVGDQFGLVEQITLRITQLRNLEGELITIPNGSIGTVRNLSSEWSQVNYAVEVRYDSDVDEAMNVMEDVAQTLYRDPQWREAILDAPEMLGVENIAHTGILIRLLIKTQPLQQWPVAREFRRRLKKAFDEKGIDVGIPQQMEYVSAPAKAWGDLY
ncbi:MAG: mechanosensitive ion channel family protein [Synechococcus sp.]